MLEQRDVGHRVVVRRRAGLGAHGRPVFTDVLGELRRLDEGQIVLRRDDGTDHAVARDSVIAAKRVPPRPARFAEIAAVERVANAAWPAPVQEHLGDWILRAAGGWTARANSALPLGEAGLPVAQAVAACVAWYRHRGLVPAITVPLPLRRDVRDILMAAHWYAQPVVLVQTARLTDVLDVAGPQAVPAQAMPAQAMQALQLSERPSPEFLRFIEGRKGSMPAVAHHVLTAAPVVRFVEIWDSPVRDRARLLAVARGAVVEDWLHLSLVEVAPPARRLGLARRASRTLARWAATAGAVRGLLQVEQANVAAVELYRRLGFHTHHRYLTFTASDEIDPGGIG